ncbi:response regulator transcription factor [Pedobacter psychrodurus]|uniref:response regulator transcription factor n=1 Tax=Pedobacter psychrodurus TaxID=2530456 RepID=UPI00292DD8F8|nr:response regulator [Pedobacter psychrodurus]
MKKILVVDDNTDILELIVMIFELEGFEVVGLKNGLEMESMVATYQPDVILLDVLLGNVDGRYLCHLVKSDSKTSHIPVIMISASHAAKSIQEDYCHPDDFVSKPFDIDDLTARVRKVLI